MNQKDLIKHVALHTGEQQVTVGRILRAIQETIKNSLAADDRVSLANFGTFEAAMTRPRRAHDLQAAKTGQPQTVIDIPARRKVKFRESQQFTDQLQRKDAQQVGHEKT